MTIAEACLRLADELPVSLVESLIIQLRGNAAPVMPSPGYQARVDDFLRRWSEKRRDLAAMLEVALAANRLAPTSVVTLKAAIRGHFKTGHRDWPET